MKNRRMSQPFNKQEPRTFEDVAGSPNLPSDAPSEEQAGENVGEEQKIESEGTGEVSVTSESHDLDRLFAKNKKFTDNYEQRGLYIRKDLDAILTKMAKKGGKGTKTTIVNAALQRLFDEMGWK